MKLYHLLLLVSLSMPCIKAMEQQQKQQFLIIVTPAPTTSAQVAPAPQAIDTKTKEAPKDTKTQAENYGITPQKDNFVTTNESLPKPSLPQLFLTIPNQDAVQPYTNNPTPSHINSQQSKQQQGTTPSNSNAQSPVNLNSPQSAQLQSTTPTLHSKAASINRQNSPAHINSIHDVLVSPLNINSVSQLGIDEIVKSADFQTKLREIITKLIVLPRNLKKAINKVTPNDNNQEETVKQLFTKQIHRLIREKSQTISGELINQKTEEIWINRELYKEETEKAFCDCSCTIM